MSDPAMLTAEWGGDLASFEKAARLDQMLRSLLTDYPVRFFLNAQSSHGALAFALGQNSNGQ